MENKMKHIRSYKLFENSKYVLNAYEEAFNREYSNKGYTKDDFEEIISILNVNCSDFLDELSLKKQYPLFRGVSNKEDVTAGMWEKTARDDRFPRDSAGEFSEDFDDAFEDKFGVRLRSNGVFTTKSPSVATSYAGSYYMFFPIDGYRYYHNNAAVDLFALQPEYYDYPDEYSDRLEEVLSKIKYWVDGYKLNSIQEAGLCEITFICKKYYLVDVAFYKDICDYLGLEVYTKNP